MDSFRRLFGHRDDDQSSTAGSVPPSSVGTPYTPSSTADDDDSMVVDSAPASRSHAANDDDMPELLSDSDSSDSDADDGDGSVQGSPSAAAPRHPQISPSEATPDRRPRVEEVIDDDDRLRRTPRTATPEPSAATADGAGDRPVRPLPRAFSSARRMPMAGSYVMQGVSFAVPRHVPPAPQEQLVEPVAAPPPMPPQNNNTNNNSNNNNNNNGNNNGGGGNGNGGQTNAQDPPPWLSNLLNSIFTALAHSSVRPPPETPTNPASDGGPTQAQPGADGSRGGSMNFLFPDVGVAASATARRAPAETQPQGPTAQNGPAPAPAGDAQPREITLGDLHRMHQEAIRAFQGAAEAGRQGANANANANANAPQPGPQAVPIPVPVPIPFPFPLFGGFHDEPSEDPGQARRLIEGLEEVPAGLVRRYMRVEKATDGSAGACAVCFDELDCEFGEEAAPQWASNTPQQDAPAAPPAPAAAPSSPDAPRPDSSDPAPAPEEPLRPRIVVLPCGHAFHSTCLQPWFSHHTTCPSCRYNVDPDGLTSSAYVDGRHRHGPFANFTPPAAFLADLLAHLSGTAPQPAPAQPNAAQAQPAQQAPLNMPPPPLGTSQRFTFNLGPFPVGGSAAPSPQAQGAAAAPLPPGFPFGLWPPAPPPQAPQQAGQQGPQTPPAPGTGPRIHHQAHHHHIVDGIETIFDTFEIELDIGVTVPVGSGRNTPAAANDAQQQQMPPPPQAQPQQEQQHQQRREIVPPLEMLFHFVAPIDHALHEQHQQQQQQQEQHQQQHQQPQPQPQPQQAGDGNGNGNANANDRPPRPDATRLPSLHDLFRGPLAGVPPTPGQRRAAAPRRKWARPEPQGRTIRQHVEKRERELGLRCDSVCCDLAPTDDDPEPALHGETPKLVRLRDASHAGKQCTHEFHPQCIVTAARIAAEGAGREAADPSAVSCPICRAEGSVDPADWAAGELALQAEVE